LNEEEASSPVESKPNVMVDFNDTMFKENVPNVRVEEYYHVKSPVQNKRKIKKYKYLLME